MSRNNDAKFIWSQVEKGQCQDKGGTRWLERFVIDTFHEGIYSVSIHADHAEISVENHGNFILTDFNCYAIERTSFLTNKFIENEWISYMEKLCGEPYQIDHAKFLKNKESSKEKIKS